MKENLFGTDGIRGLANKYPITGEVAMVVGRALATVLKEYSYSNTNSLQSPSESCTTYSTTPKRHKIVIGKDTRISGYMLESALASGICSVGADAIFLGTIPTAGVAYMTRHSHAHAGVMISASHNHFSDNGIKIFSGDGFKLPDEMEERITKLVLSEELKSSLPTGDRIGTISRIEYSCSRYQSYLKSLFPKKFALQGMKVALDCAHGASYKIAPALFRELGAVVEKVGVRPTGENINLNCGAVYPKKISQLTLESHSDIGISLDGDSDRCLLSDENGEIVDGDQIIGICAIYLAAENRLRNNTIVTTPMSNIGLALSLAKYGISTEQAKVGDRHVVEMMKKNDYSLGGEQSGHVIFLDSSTTGDGILTALQIMEIMKKTGSRLSELKKAIQLYPQVRVDVKVSRKEPFAQYHQITDAINTAQYALKNKGRVFVRYSGTEPLARVMLEGENYDQISFLSQNIATSLQQVLN